MFGLKRGRSVSILHNKTMLYGCTLESQYMILHKSYYRKSFIKYAEKWHVKF